MRRVSLWVFSALLVVGTSSWGFLVHKTIHQLAVYRLPKKMAPFFYENMNYLVTNAPRPDNRRNQDSTEATRHFIDLEMFGPDAANQMPADWNAAMQRYSKDSLVKYGYVPYHVVFMKNKLTDAFRSGNADSILFYAADLGHYIGDAHVPLHTTANYDGQLTNQRGLHSLWESTVPELDMKQWNLYSKHKADYLPDPGAAIWTAVRHAATLVPGLLEKERTVSLDFTDSRKYVVKTSRGREIKSYSTEFATAYARVIAPEVNEQLLRSAELIADFWYTSWVDAGRPDLNPLLHAKRSTIVKDWKRQRRLYRHNGLVAAGALLAN